MKTIIIFAVLLLHINCSSQTKERDSVENLHFVVDVGMRQPLGKLSNKFGTSPEFGLWYRTTIGEKDLFDSGISFYSPQDSRQFDYFKKDSIYSIKAEGLCATASLRFSRVYALRGKYYKSIHWVSLYGAAIFSLPQTPRKSSYKKDKQSDRDNVKDKYEGLNTFVIGQGVRLNYKDFGLQLNYYYSPYGMFSGNVPKDFGSHSIQFGMTYQIKI